MTNNQRDAWKLAGLPEQVISYVEGMAEDMDGAVVTERANRFGKFALESYKNAESLREKWSAIEAAAKPENDSLLTLFITMPDRPEYQPFKAIYGDRGGIDPGEEQDRYRKDLVALRHIEDLLNPHKRRFLDLLRDAGATPDAHTACFEFRAVEQGFMDGLRKLHKLLEAVDPKAKIPTKHWASPQDAAAKNYAIMVASLNRHLTKSKHAALAFLANVNCPDVKVTAEQIRKAWDRGADKRT